MYHTSTRTQILPSPYPLSLQDGILLPFEPFLEYDDFAVRIAERDIPNMVDILRVRRRGQRGGEW